MLLSIGQRAAALISLLLLVATGTAISQQQAGPQPTVTRIRGLAYPRLANQARIEGAVELVAKVSTTGAVDNVRVISGHPLLVDSAKRALQGWRFRCPDPSNTCEAKVSFTFKLADEYCDKSSCASELELDLPNAVTVQAQRLRAIIN
jgi:TonB family protein